MNPEPHDWSVATWEGARREQLRRSLRLSLRERMQAMEDLAEVARHFQKMRAEGRFRHTLETRGVK
jgi:hypothetical protein